MSNLSLEQKIGQLFILGFTGDKITSDHPIVEDIEKRNLGGVILFDRFLAAAQDSNNIIDAGQLNKLSASLQKLADNDIRIGHVQVSSALRLLDSNISLLKRFQESCYLHQTVGRTADGRLLRYDDLDQAIGAAPEDVEEWRVHFHVPVFMEKTGECGSTRFFLEEILPLLPASLPLEVETYTWTILPAELKNGTVTDCLIEEIDWVAKNMEKRQ